VVLQQLHYDDTAIYMSVIKLFDFYWSNGLHIANNLLRPFPNLPNTFQALPHMKRTIIRGVHKMIAKVTGYAHGERLRQQLLD